MRTRKATHSTERVASRSTTRALASERASAAASSSLRCCSSCRAVLLCFAKAFTPNPPSKPFPRTRTPGPRRLRRADGRRHDAPTRFAKTTPSRTAAATRLGLFAYSASLQARDDVRSVLLLVVVLVGLAFEFGGR